MFVKNLLKQVPLKVAHTSPSSIDFIWFTLKKADGTEHKSSIEPGESDSFSLEKGDELVLTRGEG